jgi:hypothetical protein
LIKTIAEKMAELELDAQAPASTPHPRRVTNGGGIMINGMNYQINTIRVFWDVSLPRTPFERISEFLGHALAMTGMPRSAETCVIGLKREP